MLRLDVLKKKNSVQSLVFGIDIFLILVYFFRVCENTYF